MPSSDYNKIISTINSVSSNYSYSPDPDNLICIDSSNNRIGINTLNPTEAIDISGGNIRAKDFIFTETINNAVSLKELLNNKASIDVSGNIVPLRDVSSSLGSSLKRWSNAYIRDVSVTNIDVSGNLNPLIANSSNLGTSSKNWGDAYIIKINGSTYTGTSDDRVKHNEVIINNGLDVIDQLTPKFYQKTLTMLDASYNGDLSGYAWNYESGLIAQELLQISDLSFVVSGGDYYDSTNNLIKQTYGVNYNSVFVYGLAAIKELHTKVKTQETTILSLQTAMLEQQTTILSLQTAMLEQQTIINNILLAQGQGPHIT